MQAAKAHLSLRNALSRQGLHRLNAQYIYENSGQSLGLKPRCLAENAYLTIDFIFFYVRRIRLYLYKYRVYGTISKHPFERSIFCLTNDIKFKSEGFGSIKIYCFE